MPVEWGEGTAEGERENNARGAPGGRPPRQLEAGGHAALGLHQLQQQIVKGR